MTYSDRELNDAEESVTLLASATKLTEREIIEVFEDGLALKYRGKIPPHFMELIDELKATFDAY